MTGPARPAPGWAAVDRYLVDALLPADPALDAALRANADAGLPAIDVAPNQGRMLALLARIAGARAILEIGTLGGFSTIWLARALPPDGRLVTLELDPRYAAVAEANLRRAGAGDLVEIRVGPSADGLAALAAEGAGPFDLVFIDADKSRTTEDFQAALRLSRPGTVIVADNVVRAGAVADPGDPSASARGMRRFIEHLAAEPRVSATAIQTVGAKGHDGFVLAVVEDVEA